MANEVAVRRKALRRLLGAGAPTSLPELEALYASKVLAGTQVATATVEGSVKKVASQPAAAGANPTKAEYDALLTAMRTAGVMV